MLLSIIVFIVVLLGLVLIHEFGHFITAKLFNVKVEEFAFGFPPRLFGVKKGETEYSFNALPIGGYVKLYGEDEAGGGRPTLQSKDIQVSPDEKRAFYAQKPSKRFAIGVAGVIMNFFLAVVLSYVFLFSTNFNSIIPCIGNPPIMGGTTHRFCSTEILEVQKGTPAEKAGIKPHSRVLSVDGQDLSASPKNFSQIVNENKGKVITILLENETTKQNYSVHLTPRVNPPKGQGSMGVVFSGDSYIIVSYDSLSQKLISGVSYPINVLSSQISAIGQLLGISFSSGNFSPFTNNVSGVVCIGASVNQALQAPTRQEATINILNLIILLSTALAFTNILPIPALDGGRLFFILIEWVSGKKNPELEAKIHAIGMYILLALMAWIILHDIMRLTSGGC